MKKLLCILLAFYFLMAGLMPNMDVHELTKLPELMAHYAEHSQSDNGTNFIEFIAFHYGADDHTPSDGHTLPFKTSTCCVVAVSFITITEPFHLHYIPEISFQKFSDTYTFPFTSSFITSIWQPPQIS